MEKTISHLCGFKQCRVCFTQLALAVEASSVMKEDSSLWPGVLPSQSTHLLNLLFGCTWAGMRMRFLSRAL